MRHAGADDDRRGGMYVVSVVLPAVQAEFGVARADASLPYTLLMIGFGLGGMLMGRLADRFGVMRPLLIGAAGLGCGFIGAGAVGQRLAVRDRARRAASGCSARSATFAPLVADTSLWFVRRRGIAVAICASGNYLAGAIWPPIVQHFVEHGRLAPDLHRPGRVLRRHDAAAGAAACARRPPHGRQPAPSAGALRHAVAAPVRAVARRARRRCCASPAWPAAWRCRCRRCTSSPTAATSATAPRAARRCCR